MNAEDIVKLLATETKRRILKLLAMEPLTLSELAERLGISQPAVLKHIRELESSGIIKPLEIRDSMGRLRRCYKISKPMRIVMRLDGDSLKIYLREAAPSEEFPKDLEEKIAKLKNGLSEIRSSGSLGEVIYRSTEIIKEIENILEQLEEMESQLLWMRYEVLKLLSNFTKRLS